jgi:arsenite methyltransferase
LVATAEMPEALRGDVAALIGCVAGAARVDEVTSWLAAVGFSDVRVSVVEESRAVIAEWFPGTGAERFVASASIEAVKPGGARSTIEGSERAARGCCAPACCEEPKA